MIGSLCNWGYLHVVQYKAIRSRGAITCRACSQPVSPRAADLPVKAKKPVADLPFFLLIDDRVTYSWMLNGTDPGAYSADQAETAA